MGKLEEAQWSGVRQKDACGAKREEIQDGDQVGISLWGRVTINNEKHIKETGGEMYVDVSMDECSRKLITTETNMLGDK